MRRILVIAITVSSAAAPLAAQIKPATSPQEPSAIRNARRGFWIGFGFGAGSEGVHCSGCSTTRTDDVSGYLKLGGSVSQHILLGGEINGWSHTSGGVDATLGFGTGTLTWYPSATGAFFLKAGLGVLTYTETDGTNKLEATAGAAGIGLGYDWRVGRNFSITPFFNSLASTPAKFTVNGQSASAGQDVSFSLVQVGIGVTWH